MPKPLFRMTIGERIAHRYCSNTKSALAAGVEIDAAIKAAKGGDIDLDLVADEKLLQALQRRYTACVFAWVQDKTEAEYTFNLRPFGIGPTVLGLLEFSAMSLKMKLCGIHANANQPPEDKDDA